MPQHKDYTLCCFDCKFAIKDVSSPTLWPLSNDCSIESSILVRCSQHIPYYSNSRWLVLAGSAAPSSPRPCCKQGSISLFLQKRRPRQLCLWCYEALTHMHMV